ncbi:predicted protein [Sclerotinia sclerotiorum 1980 UF-70]|uniref:Uncharacterized protein n=1 Tax=Sclerotinia sclerotiorum (strain ATCC 18683 / 1980 / Ss-1) TaxID=665079 RepID=A7E456_SCLS1|nr:predicted protein [Sclerotinia sclerotiorum 1980 UF-70]EDN90678.1 predicted protein [Sclerotinia sclerotiorum 1980 UF-70]
MSANYVFADRLNLAKSDPAWAFIHQSIVLSDSLHLREATILVPTITSIMAQNSCKDTR